MRTGAAVPAGLEAVSPLQFVSCGLPLSGYQVRVVDESGRELRERAEGRLEFKGPSATRGYFRNPQGTARLIRDGWLDSGDRAYIAHGEIYVTGRIKDIVIRAGRHIYPDEVEAAVGEVEGVRKGCVAVFGSLDAVGGTERLIVLAETYAQDAAALGSLRARITQRVSAVLGEPPDEVVLAAPHTVPKTSSGKVRRATSRELYESGRRGVQARAVWSQIARLELGAIGPTLRRARLRIAEALYAGYFWTLLVLLMGSAWAISAVMPRPVLAWKASGAAARWFLRLAGIPFVIRGADKLPYTPCIVVANHSSYLDGLIMIAALPQQCSFVAKRELERSWISRVYLRSIGAEFVERFDSRASVEDAERLAGKACAGRSFMFFPEGTFTRAPGLMSFHLGAFTVAVNAKLPVVPIAIRGARSLLRDEQWFPRRGPIVVDVGEPIAALVERDAFAAAVKLRDVAREHIRHHCGEPDMEPD
jgi:1-acyl-sn-glycerol-3-phosphate acyltransferase